MSSLIVLKAGTLLHVCLCNCKYLYWISLDGLHDFLKHIAFPLINVIMKWLNESLTYEVYMNEVLNALAYLSYPFFRLEREF